uniref:NADPH-dependent diflavin oxidoreductase 1 n=1 Tax=Caenorhabditis tropicalis TaxID=1561998 RepID=A0A1I7V4S7_9PELO
MTSILILYGSETGTAQDLAESMGRECYLRHITARVYDMDEYELGCITTEKVILFIVSTTGQGEMPPNMRRMWRILLRKSLKPDVLKGVHVAVLGLGDSSYQKYNFAAKKLYRRLFQLGAVTLTIPGLANDQHELGIDGAFIPWKKEVWKEVKKLDIFPEMTLDPDPAIKIRTRYRFFYGEGAERYQDDGYVPLKVISNRRVTSEGHFQDTRLIDFEMPSYPSYKPGDVLMVRPYNPTETLQIALDALGYSDELLDRPTRILNNDPYVKPPPCFLVGTLRKCLERLWDLQQIPKRSFFEMLAYYSRDRAEKERLKELASPEGLDDLLDYANRSRRTTAETLRDFPASAKNLPPDALFEILTFIRPRAFSIASAPSPSHVELLVAKVEYKSRMSDARRGLCSTFLSRLKEGDEVYCKIRPGTFRFPDPEVPVICIGPGTGVAPFRSLFGHGSSKGLLFFGCRGEHSDFYFSDEWKDIEGVEVIPAFSRDTEKKIYVQHKMRERAADIKRLLEAGASVFIAGSAGEMPKAVSEVLTEIQGEEWMKKAEETGGIQFETWS